MRRFGQVIGLQPGAYATYVRAHAAVWPSVLGTITACNIRNYSIYALGEDRLFAYFEYVGEDFAADMARMAEDPETQRWWAEMEPLQAPLAERAQGEWWMTLREVFHHD